jgi:hypothetical protein
MIVLIIREVVMSSYLQIPIFISFIGLFVLILYYFLKNRRWQTALLQLALLGLAFLLVYYFFLAPKPPTSRGANSPDLYVVIVLYVFMLLGMLAQYLYSRLEQPQATRPRFDLGLFLAPVFASPMIFIPLLAALQNANLDLQHLTTPRIMVFLVAFENGFFWKELFDHRRKLKEAGK